MKESFIEKFLNNLRQDRNIRGNSEKWANWMSILSITTCQKCVEGHGTIAPASILEGHFEKPVNEHENCYCKWVRMRTKVVGTATNTGINGADYFLFYQRRLPDYYIDKNTAYRFGWKTQHKHLDKAVPNKMLGGDLYKNDDSKLPSAPGRIWYEADINYTGGKRNRQRILYSNDGLIFVTYDHYQTFYEITA